MRVLDGKGTAMTQAGSMNMRGVVPPMTANPYPDGTYYFDLPALQPGRHTFEAQLTKGGPKRKFDITVEPATKAEMFQVECDDGAQDIPDQPIGPPVRYIL